jgi:hypothetical protein
LIAWAVGQCRLKRIPPSDANILVFVCEWTGVQSA